MRLYVVRYEGGEEWLQARSAVEAERLVRAQGVRGPVRVYLELPSGSLALCLA